MSGKKATDETVLDQLLGKLEKHITKMLKITLGQDTAAKKAADRQSLMVLALNKSGNLITQAKVELEKLKNEGDIARLSSKATEKAYQQVLRELGSKIPGLGDLLKKTETPPEATPAPETAPQAPPVVTSPPSAPVDAQPAETAAEAVATEPIKPEAPKAIEPWSMKVSVAGTGEFIGRGQIRPEQAYEWSEAPHKVIPTTPLRDGQDGVEHQTVYLN